MQESQGITVRPGFYTRMKISSTPRLDARPLVRSSTSQALYSKTYVIFSSVGSGCTFSPPVLCRTTLVHSTMGHALEMFAPVSLYSQSRNSDLNIGIWYTVHFMTEILCNLKISDFMAGLALSLGEKGRTDRGGRSIWRGTRLGRKRWLQH